MRALRPDHLTFWLMGPSMSRQRAAHDVEQRMRRNRGGVFVGLFTPFAPAPLSCAATVLALQAKRPSRGRSGVDIQRWETVLRQRYPDLTILMCFTHYKVRSAASVDETEPARALSVVELWPCARQPQLNLPSPLNHDFVFLSNVLAGRILFPFDKPPEPGEHMRSTTGLTVTGLSLMSKEALEEVSCFLKSQLWEGQLEAFLPSRSSHVSGLPTGRL